MDRVSLTFSQEGNWFSQADKTIVYGHTSSSVLTKKFPGGGGKTDMKRPGILVGKFELNPYKGDQSGCGLNFFISSIAP